MGRNSTGIYEAMECKRIELTYLIKNGYIKKGCKTKGQLSWSSNDRDMGDIGIECAYLENEKYIRLIYTTTNRDNVKTNYDYKVDLIGLPSNLGKGEILYMMCPSGNGQRCRKLYMAYGTEKWYSRQYFLSRGVRIYYPSQARSINDYVFNRRDVIKKEIAKIWSKNFHAYHKGRKTKTLLKLERLEKDRDYWELLIQQQLIKYFGVVY